MLSWFKNLIGLLKLIKKFGIAEIVAGNKVGTVTKEGSKGNYGESLNVYAGSSYPGTLIEKNSEHLIQELTNVKETTGFWTKFKIGSVSFFFVILASTYRHYEHEFWSYIDDKLGLEKPLEGKIYKDAKRGYGYFSDWYNSYLDKKEALKKIVKEKISSPVEAQSETKVDPTNTESWSMFWFLEDINWWDWGIWGAKFLVGTFFLVGVHAIFGDFWKKALGGYNAQAHTKAQTKDLGGTVKDAEYLVTAEFKELKNDITTVKEGIKGIEEGILGGHAERVHISHQIHGDVDRPLNLDPRVREIFLKEESKGQEIPIVEEEKAFVEEIIVQHQGFAGGDVVWNKMVDIYNGTKAVLFKNDSLSQAQINTPEIPLKSKDILFVNEIKIEDLVKSHRLENRPQKDLPDYPTSFYSSLAHNKRQIAVTTDTNLNKTQELSSSFKKANLMETPICADIQKITVVEKGNPSLLVQQAEKYITVQSTEMIPAENTLTLPYNFSFYTGITKSIPKLEREIIIDNQIVNESTANIIKHVKSHMEKDKDYQKFREESLNTLESVSNDFDDPTWLGALITSIASNGFLTATVGGVLWVFSGPIGNALVTRFATAMVLGNKANNPNSNNGCCGGSNNQMVPYDPSMNGDPNAAGLWMSVVSTIWGLVTVYVAKGPK